MRTNLQGLNGKDVDMTAQFCGFFSCRIDGRVFRSALLHSVRSASGQMLTDHAWVRKPWAFEIAGIEEGDCIAFTGVSRSTSKASMERTLSGGWRILLR
jgi:hypothetical protein